MDIDWDLYRAEYDPGADACVPDERGTQTDGPDVVHRIDLSPDDLLSAELDRRSGDYISMYVVTNCARVASSCLTGVNDGRFDDEELEYFNDTGLPQTVYLIADIEQDSSYRTSELTLTVERRVCTPGIERCSASGDAAETCNDRGTGWDSRSCAFGCTAGTCDQPPNDMCSGATPVQPTLTQPYSTSIDWNLYVGHYDPGRQSCVPVDNGTQTDGPDAVYAVTLEPMRTMTVELDRQIGDYVSMYIVDDCTDVAGSCVVGVNAGLYDDETLVYVNDTANPVTLTLIADVEDDVTYGSSTLDISVEEVVCTPNSGTCTGPDDIELCNDEGTGTTVETCPYGCSVGNGVCLDPPHDRCGGAIDTALTLTSGFTETIEWTRFDPDYDPGLGSCVPDNSGTQTDGPDGVYRVDLGPQQGIDVELDRKSGDYVSLYLVDDCMDVAASCVAGANAGSSDDERLVYVNNSGSSQSLYLIADARSGASRTADLSIDLFEGCDPTSAPVCASNTELQYCDDIGRKQTYTCDGMCSGGACATPSGDICLDAIDVDAASGAFPKTFTGTLTDHEDDYDFGGQSCTGWDAPGPDVSYRVTVPAGQTLDASAFGTDSSSPLDLALYVLTDCSDPSQSCVSGSDQVITGQTPEAVTYSPSTTETVYVIVDSFLGSPNASSAGYQIDIDVK
jgi:hypothetical protein